MNNSNNDNKDTYKVVGVQNVDGCPTKFRPGRYHSTSPEGAAKKAFSRLCNLKKIKGKCTLLVTVKRTTQGGDKKEFTYKLHRSKLSKPIVMMKGTPNEYKILYEVHAQSAKMLKNCVPGRERSRGVMKRMSRRANKGKNLKSKKVVMKNNKKSMNNNMRMRMNNKSMKNNKMNNKSLRGGKKSKKSRK